MKQRILIALLCFLAGSGMIYGAVENSTKRFGLFIGSNNGGRDRTALRYAVSDARTVSGVFSEMGGIGAEDSILLVEPTIREINRQISILHNRVLDSKRSYKRTELVFYYSGHSDEAGLLLNREQYNYKDLREQINTIPADMRIVILDSCSSGAFTRLKGGVKTQPFLIDDSISAEGYAFLTSSSANEASQESDSIASSYFTHSLVTGLRGAADTVGDGRVTLNEVYRFAYAETLAKTETSVFGAQHPSYDMQVSGTGDVVLTDIKETSAGLIIDGNIIGRLSIRDSSDHLVAEITKTNVKPMELGLEPGLYRIILQRGDNFSRAEVFLSKDRRTPLGPADFKLIAAAQAAARGDVPAADSETNPAEPKEKERRGFNFQFVPGLKILHIGSEENSNDHFLLGILGAQGDGLDGAGLAFIWLNNSGTVEGLQASGIYNTIGGDLWGVQAAGIYNMTQGNVTGLQAAGIFNMSRGNVTGLQSAGIFNMTQGDMTGLQAAMIFNMTGNMTGVRAAGIFNMTQGNMTGAQATAIFNNTVGSGIGLQSAGIVNFVKEDFKGAQVSGLFNYTGGDFRGVQAAGIINLARGNTHGLQVGPINRGGEGGGVQIGLVNISQNESIIPIGLVNVVKGGIMHPAIYYDSMGFLNFSLRSGSRFFYSVFGVGAQKIYLHTKGEDRVIFGRNKDDALLVFRGGVGFEFPIRSVFVNVDVVSGSILNLDTISEAGYDSSASIISQARLTAGFKIFEHLGVFVGLSYDYIHLESETSPIPKGKLDYVFSWGNSRNINKLGFFAGIQF
jgi:hypothetical protein